MDIEKLSSLIKRVACDNDRISFSGRGCFLTQIMPASITDRGTVINPPYKRLYYRSNATSPDNLLAEAYSAEAGCTIDAARTEIDQFVAQFCQDLDRTKTMVLPGLGKMRATALNEYFFISDPGLDIFPDGRGLVPINMKVLHPEEAAEPVPPVVAEPMRPAAVEPVLEPEPAVSEPEPAVSEPDPVAEEPAAEESAAEPETVPEPATETPESEGAKDVEEKPGVEETVEEEAVEEEAVEEKTVEEESVEEGPADKKPEPKREPVIQKIVEPILEKVQEESSVEVDVEEDNEQIHRLSKVEVAFVVIGCAVMLLLVVYLVLYLCRDQAWVNSMLYSPEERELLKYIR